MKTGSKPVRVVLNVILWAVIVIAAAFSIVTFATKGDGGVASIGGYTPMTVLSNSMVPTFESGDLIIVKETDPAELEVGDVISFWTIIDNYKVINTHRIVEVVGSGDVLQFMTKGDANDLPDSLPVSQGDLVGKYSYKVPVLGQILTFISSSMGFLIVIVIPLLIFFVWQFYKLMLLLVEMKKENARKISEEEKAKLEAEIREKIKAEQEEKEKQGKTEKQEKTENQEILEKTEEQEQPEPLEQPEKQDEQEE